MAALAIAKLIASSIVTLGCIPLFVAVMLIQAFHLTIQDTAFYLSP